METSLLLEIHKNVKDLVTRVDKIEKTMVTKTELEAVKKNMATKQDIKNVNKKIKTLDTKVDDGFKTINDRLDVLETEALNHGWTINKEIK